MKICIFVSIYDMGIVFLMMMVSISLALAFLVIFIIGAKRGQFDEGESPAIRILKEDNAKHKKEDK